DRPAARQVTVNRRLGVDRDVLVQARPALARDIPRELALGFVSVRRGAGTDAFGGWRGPLGVCLGCSRELVLEDPLLVELVFLDQHRLSRLEQWRRAAH